MGALVTWHLRKTIPYFFLTCSRLDTFQTLRTGLSGQADIRKESATKARVLGEDEDPLKVLSCVPDLGSHAQALNDSPPESAVSRSSGGPSSSGRDVVENMRGLYVTMYHLIFINIQKKQHVLLTRALFAFALLCASALASRNVSCFCSSRPGQQAH